MDLALAQPSVNPQVLTRVAGPEVLWNGARRESRRGSSCAAALGILAKFSHDHLSGTPREDTFSQVKLTTPLIWIRGEQSIPHLIFISTAKTFSRESMRSDQHCRQLAPPHAHKPHPSRTRNTHINVTMDNSAIASVSVRVGSATRAANSALRAIGAAVGTGRAAAAAGTATTMEPLLQATVEKIAAKYGHKVVYTPPYHSDLQPIEIVWAIAKQKVAAAYRTGITMQEVLTTLHAAFASLTPATVYGCYKRVLKHEALAQKMVEEDEAHQAAEDEEAAAAV